MQEAVHKHQQAKQKKGSTRDDACSMSSLPTMPDIACNAAAAASLVLRLNPIESLAWTSKNQLPDPI